MTDYYPIVFETEASGAISAYVPGLPVYAAADTLRDAETAIERVLTAYLHEHPDAKPQVALRVGKHIHGPRTSRVSLVGLSALVGHRSSKRKAIASRANGRLGGRPRRKARTSHT
jgi:hypothetical protein